MTSWKNVSGSAFSVPVLGRDVADQEEVVVPDGTVMPACFSIAVAPTNVVADSGAGTVSWDPPAGVDVVDYLVDEWSVGVRYFRQLAQEDHGVSVLNGGGDCHFSGSEGNIRPQGQKIAVGRIPRAPGATGVKIQRTERPGRRP